MREEDLLREIEREGEARALELKKKYSVLARKKREEHRKREEEFWEARFSVLEREKSELVESEVSRIRNGAKRRLATLKKELVDDVIREALDSFWNTREYGRMVERLVSGAVERDRVVKLVGARGDKYLEETGKKHGVPVSLDGERGVVIVLENGMLDYSLSSIARSMRDELEIVVGSVLFPVKSERKREEERGENRKTNK